VTAPVTVADLRHYLEAVPDGEAEDDKLQAYIDRAWGTITTYLGFEYAAYPGAATALVVAHAGGSTLHLPAHEAGSITAVTDSSGSTVLSTTYAENADGGLYFTVNNYPYGASGYGLPLWAPGRYTVTAKWGYGPTAPDALKQLCLEVAVSIWTSRDPTTAIDDTVDRAGDFLRYRGGLTPVQHDTLRRIKAGYHTRVLA
jgi:hypothetical protein